MKMKSLKAQFIGAIAMVLVAAIAMGSSTYAWFAMNTQVTATNMKVKAVAENGIVISNTNKGTWSNSANAQVNAADLTPTSAAAVAAPAWVHAMSTNADEAQGGQVLANYTGLTLAWDTNTTEGIGYTDNNTSGKNDTGDTSYVLLNNFYIKSSADAITGTLYINDVAVTSSASGGAFNKLDNALRILVVVNNSDAFVFAPVYNQAGGATSTTYTWKATTPVKARYEGGTGDFANQDLECSSVTAIPNTDVGAINVKVYMYFEGEDANLKSTNITGLSMNDLSATIKFGTAPTHNSGSGSGSGTGG